ncbi:Protein kinase family protein [Quillaja saponaria]|uniref:Protein kinase family protein n=1 Tax=Quillaja saponaria TaxID=32244 RepID=A0AAD7P7U8_QUISA|nr:Protein kinase family protein [Quillaja saponaria]
MEQFRHIGEVLGSLKAVMVLQDDIQINQRQCCLLFDIFTLAFETISGEIGQNLKLEEKNTKWKALEQPLREIYRVFKEGELYIRQCLDYKDWWGKAITLYQNNDCIEFHIHNLLCYFPAVIEAIENAGEISGLDQDEMQKRTIVLKKKYDVDWNDPILFQWKFGKQYLVPREICKRLGSAWREDRWRFIEALKEKKSRPDVDWTKNEQRLGDLLLKKLLNGSDQFHGKLFPSAILLGAKDYQVRRRLGEGSRYKEIQWFGETFALRQFLEVQNLNAEISTLLSLSHPNILQYLCGFYDEEKKEFFLVMELMSKSLQCYMKENCGPRRQILFSIPVVIDLMLQVARGMEYLHSRKIYHGNLDPSNIFLKARNSSEGYFQAKVSGFGLSSIKDYSSRTSPNETPKEELTNPSIWYAPEVLTEQEQPGSTSNSKYTEKADVYSFGMLSFELLTGKIPFEDNHLQGEKSSRNIKVGERPLFPFPSPKYIVSLIKKCWQTDPTQRPSFSSICRILRNIKKFLAMNPEQNQPGLNSPPVDYCEVETMFLKKFQGEGTTFDFSSVSQIPFQMFAYRLAEKGKTFLSNKDKNSETATEETSICRSIVEDSSFPASDTRSFLSDVKSVRSEPPLRILAKKKPPEAKVQKERGPPKSRGLKPSPLSPSARGSPRMSQGRPLPWAMSPLSPVRSPGRRRRPGQILDSQYHNLIPFSP